MNSITPSLFLFGKPAKDIFVRKFSPSFANASLEVMMKVIVYFLANKKAFFLLTPNSANNQCHIYAMRTALIQRKYSKLNNKERLAYTEENRFLFLSFFLSFHFATNKSLLCDVIKTVQGETSLELPKPEKKFFQFSRDSEGNRTRQSRESFIRIYKVYLRTELQLKDTPLYRELHTISANKLELPLNRGKGVFYTFPKFSGVVYFTDKIGQHTVATMLRVKVITESGTGEITYVSLDPTKPMILANEIDRESITGDEAVIVFEGIATNGALLASECLAISRKCPKSFRHVSGRRNLHPIEKNCLFCEPGKALSLAPYQKKLETVISSTETFLYPQGKNFVINRQSTFLHFFKDAEQNPCLITLFNDTAPSRGFSMAYVYPDTLGRALESGIRMNRSPTQHLEERGLL